MDLILEKSSSVDLLISDELLSLFEHNLSLEIPTKKVLVERQIDEDGDIDFYHMNKLLLRNKKSEKIGFIEKDDIYLHQNLLKTIKKNMHLSIKE
ncbi:hypothetical protein ACTFQ6_14350 [Aliivibrio fischeri]